MFISRVEIENFRNFKHLVIDPLPRTAVVVGANGIGKSNLLHALRLVLDPDLPDSARRLRNEDICEQSDSTLENGVTVRVTLDIQGISGNLASEAVCDGCFIELEPTLTARLAYIYEPMEEAQLGGGGLSHDDYDFKIVGGPAGDHDARWLRRDLSLTVLPALRDAVDALSRWRGSPLQELLEAHKPSAQALSEAANGITEVMDELATDDQIVAVGALLGSRLKSMAGSQMEITPTLGFASSVPDRLLRSLRLFVDANRTRTMAETSTGNANVVYLGLLLERLASRRSRDEVADFVLAVEEPEAHIHPVLQRQLFRYLLKEETSLVVTSHSPHIAAVTSLDAMVLLRSGVGASGSVASTASGARLSEQERSDVERYLDVSRAELLFCAAAILVEGIAEVYVLPAMASALGFDLDAHGVIVANVSGTDFAPYVKILAEDSLDIPHVVITDGDSRTKKGTYLLGGLKRGAALLSDDVDRDTAQQLLDNYLLDEALDTQPGRLHLAGAHIYVGENTLEVDLAPLLSKAMVAAMNDLEGSENLRKKFAAAVSTTGLSEDLEQRAEVLRRIEYVSKGRFAQRLAKYIEDSAESLLAAVAEATGADERVPPETVAGGTFVDTECFLDAGDFGYIFAALDEISWVVRGHGLLLEKPV